jgi:predicted aconitase
MGDERPPDIENLSIELTDDERDTLEGRRGVTLQKVMETVVRYAEALGAERLVEIEGPGHFVIPWASPGIAPPLEMLDELAEAGLETTHPFTLDPCAPLDFEPLDLTGDQQHLVQEMYSDQKAYDRRMLQLGMRDPDAYTCNPYLPEVGNVPEEGSIVAWSESACAVFANSVLGARTNRNGAIMDLLSNIVGKTPLTGLLTDEGRRRGYWQTGSGGGSLHRRARPLPRPGAERYDPGLPPGDGGGLRYLRGGRALPCREHHPRGRFAGSRARPSGFHDTRYR